MGNFWEWFNNLPLGVPFLVILAIIVFLLLLLVRKMWYEQHFIGPYDYMETLIENIDEMNLRLSKVSDSLKVNNLQNNELNQRNIKYKEQLQTIKDNLEKIKLQMEEFLKNDKCSKHIFS